MFLEAVHDEPADLVKELVAGLLPVGHLNVKLQVLHAVSKVHQQNLPKAKLMARKLMFSSQISDFEIPSCFQRLQSKYIREKNHSGFED